MTQKFNLGRNQEQVAMNKYNHLYNNALYAKAVEGKTNRYCNDLINDAMAICGHPHYSLSNRNWSPEALSFLQVYS